MIPTKPHKKSKAGKKRTQGFGMRTMDFMGSEFALEYESFTGTHQTATGATSQSSSGCSSSSPPS